MVEIPTTIKNRELVERRRRQIILAGIKLFASHGFHKTTLKDLAEEAGLSYGNIYDYVGSKEDIFFLIHDFLAGSAMEILNRSIEDIQDPVEKLRRMIHSEFNLMDQWADALLLIYQESHILKGTFLKKLLEKERAHLEMFEIVLTECIARGQMPPCNLRLASNLIKSMIDAWTIKRWDLRGHSTRLEAEHSIMDIISQGLLAPVKGVPASGPDTGSLMGKTALMVNAGTLLGQAVCSDLTARGVRVIAQVNRHEDLLQSSIGMQAGAVCKPVLLVDETDRLTTNGIDRIENEFGPVDIYLHDLGVGTTDMPDAPIMKEAADAFGNNLRLAQDLASSFKNRMGERGMGRIVYIAPWAWDNYTDPVRFEVVKAGAVALTRCLSRQLAAASVNVNCIVPGYIRGVRPLKIEKALGRKLLEEIPSGRLGEISDVLETVLFAIRDGSKYLTGQVFHVTGGQ